VNWLEELNKKNKLNSRSDEVTRGAEYSKKAEGPLSYGWLPLGMGRGIKWTLWKTNVTFQRQEKQGDKWLTTEELHVAPKVLKELIWRIPSWLESIEKNNGRRGK